jgi:hypothetical protein
MTVDETDSCGIRIYVPDAVFSTLTQSLRSQLLEPECIELDFISPGWWEKCHTSWYGAIYSPAQKRHETPSPDSLGQ